MKHLRWGMFIATVASFALLTGSAAAQTITILGGGLKGQPYQFAVGLSKLLKDKESNPESYAICIVSEGAKLAGTGDGEDEISKSNTERDGLNIGMQIAREIEARSDERTIVQELAYLMRAGEPDAMDRMVGFAYGALAVQLVKQDRTSSMVCLTDGNYDSVPIDTLLKSSKGVNVSGLYDANQYRANLMQVENMPMFLY